MVWKGPSQYLLHIQWLGQTKHRPCRPTSVLCSPLATVIGSGMRLGLKQADKTQFWEAGWNLVRRQILFCTPAAGKGN